MLEEQKEKLDTVGEVYLQVRARPGVSVSKVRDVMVDDSVKIDIAAPPEGGKANKELVKFLASFFEVSKENVKIISGAGDRIKLIKIVKNIK